MITKFDKANLKKLEADAIAALAALSAASGVKFRFASGRYNERMATLKLEVFLPGEGGETPERIAFRAMAKLHGYEVDDLDKTFTMRGVTYKICGLKVGGRSANRLLASDPNGKVYRFRDEDVLRLMGRKSSLDEGTQVYR